MRRPAGPNKPRRSQVESFPAPTAGWVANQNLARPSTQAGRYGASILENWFPTAESVVLRRGSEKYATIGDGSADAESIWSYKNGNNEKLFAATPAAIYDISTVADPDVSPAAAVSSLTSGKWVFTQFATAGGVFLRGVNGADTPRVFDGASWSTTPAITFPSGDATTPEELCYVWAAKNRLWFLKNNSLDVYYLPVNQIGGELGRLSLASVFNRGGRVMIGSSWSIESGNGLGDYVAFITTEGEAAIYQGDDPSNASDWSRVGIYRTGKPLGERAWMRAGGDLVIATDIGFVALSQSVQRDYAALSPSAVSYPIETAWNDAAGKRSLQPWNVDIWPSQQMVIVSMPTPDGELPQTFVTNARTGAWAKFTGWQMGDLEIFQDRLFFCSVDGKIIEGNVGGLDQGEIYSGAAAPLFYDLKSPAALKIPLLARATMRTPYEVNATVSVLADFDMTIPVSPSAPATESASLWGSGVWGVSTWGEGLAPMIVQDWQSVAGEGYALAPLVQITSGNPLPIDTELVRIDLTYSTADIVS